ncbi:MAG: hypothetical protein CM15mV11_1950 [Caudoviricetes sp.]|nr:MAG: hypothetical protein CM15mV11_1950 [Caudoviricetes sp.]
MKQQMAQSKIAIEKKNNAKETTITKTITIKNTES